MSVKSVMMDFFYDEIIKMLVGVTNAPAAGAQNIIPLYQPEGAGGIKDVHPDVVFYNLVFRDDGYNKQIEATISGNDDPALTTSTTKYNREFQLQFFCCGDNAFEWADTLRIMLFDRNITEDFAGQGMSLITAVREPDYAPESINQQWLERYDLRADFNHLVIKQSTIPAIAFADVIIESKNGVEATCSV